MLIVSQLAGAGGGLGLLCGKPGKRRLLLPCSAAQRLGGCCRRLRPDLHLVKRGSLAQRLLQLAGQRLEAGAEVLRRALGLLGVEGDGKANVGHRGSLEWFAADGRARVGRGSEEGVQRMR
ncbi:hypothetical protein D3C78_1070550 [compost metagenome]